MHARHLLRTAFFFCASFVSAQEPAADITLRAFLNMIEDPLAVAEGFARNTETFKTDEQVAAMKVTLPSAAIGHWLDIVEALQKELPAAERPEIFPPGLREALKGTEEVELKRALLLPAVAQIQDLAAMRATPGETPEERKLKVPQAWLESYWRARDEFARKRSDDFVRATRGEGLVMRNERGTFFRGSEGNFIKVAQPGVPEEGPVFCAPFGKNGTWNLYQAICRPLTWLQADKAAREMKAPAGGKAVAGHLASIHSEAENQFLVRLMEGIPHAWIGLNDRRLEAFRDKQGTWEWTSGEPFTFNRWTGIEPNNADTARNGGDEDGVAIDCHNIPGRDGVWTDFGDGSRNGYNHRYSFIVEWPVEAAGPIKGAEVLPGFFAEELPGVPGGEGTLGMRIVYGGGVCRTLESAREAYLSGRGRVVNTQVAGLNHRDPDRPDATVLFPDALPFPEQKEKEHDKDIAFLCRGRIRVPEAAAYTFGIVHDDGFAFRIKGQRWKSVTGFGAINPGDPECLEQWWTANGCTVATIELPAGDHDLEFFGFQGDGGGYFQLFSAKGSYAGLHETRDWRLVGHRSAGEIAIPGIAAPGWEVEATPPGKLTRPTYEGAQRALDRDGRKSAAPAPAIDFSDPDDGSELRLNGAQAFPEGLPGKKDDQFAFRARGVLEIPKRGIYWLGYQTARGGRLRIEGQKWKRLVLSAPGPAVIDEDIIESDANAEKATRVTGEIELGAGRYAIEFLGCFAAGPAAVEISGAPAKGAEVHLKAGEARVTQDLAGLELVK